MLWRIIFGKITKQLQKNVPGNHLVRLAGRMALSKTRVSEGKSQGKAHLNFDQIFVTETLDGIFSGPDAKHQASHNQPPIVMLCV